MSAKLQFAAQLEMIAKASYCGAPPSPSESEQLLLAAAGDEQLMATAQVILGHSWQHLSEHLKAQQAFLAGIQGFKAMQCKKEQTETLILLGFSHLLSHQPMLALDDWSEALKIARLLKNRKLCARIYMGIGQVYIGFGDHQAALGFNELALELARKLGSDHLKCEVLLNVASDAYRLKRFSYALQCLAEAEKLLQQSVINPIWSAEIIYYLGAVHAEQKQFAQAKIELETAFTLCDQNENMWGKAHALTALAEVLLVLNDVAAGERLQQALNLALQAGIKELQNRCHTGLIQWHIAQHHYELAMPSFNALLQNEERHTFKISAKHRQRILQLQTQSRMKLL
ncbi:tetratricopeptide repeat protein [Iodobacter arcticus]|uniref:Tetratricopeptide repeat protein n=1 Tax=Iodobacter arcticus TaxID=590593 RepID=A0ABW2QTK3_9NEIS